jgi:hypothetical protein
MNKLFYYFLLLLVTNCSFSVYGQDVFAKIPFTRVIDEIQSFSWGDSILLSVMDENINKTVHSYWLDKKGNISKSNVNTTQGSMGFVNEIIKKGSDYYAYSLGGQSQKTEVSIAKNGNWKNSTKIEVKGRSLTGFKRDQYFILVTYDKGDKTLRILEIDSNEIKQQNQDLLPFDLSQFKSNQIQFVPDNNLVMLSESTSKLKIHYTNKKLTLVADEPFEHWFTEAGIMAKTSIFTLDVNTGESEMRIILEPSQNDFRSFYFEGLLYRTISSETKYDLKVIDALGNVVTHFMMPRVEAAKKQAVFFREGRANSISMDETLFHMMKLTNSCKPLLHVERNKNNNLVVTWGTYFDSKGGGSAHGATPALAIANLIIVTTAKQLREGPGISRYFYLIEDGLGGLKFSIDDPSIARRHIDMFEISQLSKQSKYKYKACTQFNSNTLGVYYNSVEDIIEIINYGDLF